MYGKGPWLRSYEVVVENGEVIGTSTSNIPPKTPIKVYGKIIDAALLQAENIANSVNENIVHDPPEPSNSPVVDIEGKYRVLSVDRATFVADNVGYSVTFTITKQEDGSYSLIEDINRDRKYWEASIKKEIQKIQQEADAMKENLQSLPAGVVKELEEIVETMLSEIQSRKFENESSSKESASDVQSHGTRISFFFPNKAIPDEVTDLWGAKAFGWTYEGVIQNGEIEGNWSTGAKVPRPATGSFRGELLSKTSSDNDGTNNSSPNSQE